MAFENSPTFTTQGRQLFTYAQAGQCNLVFTSIVVGKGQQGTSTGTSSTSTGTLPFNIDPTKKIYSEVKRLPLNSVKAIAGDTVLIKAVFDNSGITTGFAWTEVGLYAQNPNYPNDRTKDLLYCYATAGANPEFISPAGAVLISKEISIAAVVSDATSVQALFASELFTLKSDFQDHLNDTNAHATMFAPVTLYVDGTNGNDSTADGTAGKPFKTIQKAIDFPPSSVQNVAIKICAGAYNEDVNVAYKQWAFLAIEPATASDVVSIKSAYFKNMPFVSLNKVSITGNNASAGVVACRLDYCNGVVINCTFAGATNVIGLVAYGSTIVAKSNVFNNCKFAIYGTYSVVQSDLNTGAGNITAYSCQSGQISYSQTDNIGFTLKQKQASGGGLVIDNQTGFDLSTGNYASKNIDNVFSAEQSYVPPVVIKRTVDNSYTHILGGKDDNSAYLELYGYNCEGRKGEFSLKAKTKTNPNGAALNGLPDGTLTWQEKNVVRSVNGAEADKDGNVTIPVLVVSNAPDYENAVMIPNASPYTAPSDGVIFGAITDHARTNVEAKINNAVVWITGNVNTATSVYLPVKKGDVWCSYTSGSYTRFAPWRA